MRDEGFILIALIFLVVGGFIGALINSSITRSECQTYQATTLGQDVYTCTQR